MPDTPPRKQCIWINCENDADPAVEGISGPFDGYLCAYHDEFPIEDKESNTESSE